ncbi:MAG: PAAR domain-containing protein [Azoarcus sp.]|jgi:uncharacterized Zn-binding protein involved in type VI secretion|nr:PAAR domain-containing protein [Azoarcus sp.]
MTKRLFIVLGDKTSKGGTVMTARGAGRIPFYIDGKPVACVGDQVVGADGRLYQILPGPCSSPSLLDGYQMALEGFPVSDGSYLMAIQQHHAWDEDGVSAADLYRAAVAQSAAQRADVMQAAAKPKGIIDIPKSASIAREAIESTEESTNRDKWIQFKLADVGSCEGLKCVAHFDDGSERTGTFDAQNQVTFEGVSGNQVDRIDFKVADPVLTSSVATLFLNMIGA